jgi:DNA-binding MarR family transcriptional regulator
MSRKARPPQPASHSRASLQAKSQVKSRAKTRASARALDFDSYIPAYLNFLASKLSSGASAVYRPRFGIGITDWRLMALLAAEPWVVASHICNVTGLDKAAASRSVRSLQDLGLVDVAPDRRDQRKQLVALTSKGVALHDRIVELAIAREQALLEGLSETERKTLLRFLIHLQKRLRVTNAVGMTRKP